MMRPARSASPAALLTSAGRSATSVETRWLPTVFAMSRKSSNQNAVIAVSTRPLLGIGSAMTTSNAERRSLVTMSSWSFPTA